MIPFFIIILGNLGIYINFLQAVLRQNQESFRVNYLIEHDGNLICAYLLLMDVAQK